MSERGTEKERERYREREGDRDTNIPKKTNRLIEKRKNDTDRETER